MPNKSETEMTAVVVDVVVVAAADAVAIVADIAVVITVVTIAENPILDEAAMDGKYSM